MKKKLITILLTLIVLLIIASISVSFLSAKFIKFKITDYAKKKLDISLELKGAHLSLLRRAVVANGLRVKNPPGFETDEDILRARKIEVSFNILSIFLDKTFIGKIVLTDPEFLLEKDKDGNLNLKSLIKNSKEKNVELLTKEKKKKYKFYPQQFLIKGGRIKYLNSSITDSSSFGQNKVELEDIFANIKATSLIPKDGKIPILLRILAKVASDKKGVLKVDGGGFISKDDQTISVELNAKDIDLTYLKCIFNERLRNLIGSGIVNINSPVEYNSRNIDSLTRVTLRDFEFNEDESDKFSIKGFSIAALVESFKDKDGVIDFDFRTRGTIGALRYSFGPLSQKKLAGMTINLIRNQIRSIGQKSEEIIKEKSSNTVEKIKLLIDFKDKDEASEEKEAE